LVSFGETLPESQESKTHRLILISLPDLFHYLLHAGIILFQEVFYDLIVLFDEAPGRQVKVSFKHDGVDIVTEVTSHLDVVIEKRSIGVLAKVGLKDH
jgi:hypothetical protein